VDALLWKRIGELFEAAHKLEGQERLDYLTDQCGSDKNLLDKVLSLLYADTKRLPAELPPTVTTLSIPDVVAGRFRIVRYIAEGGMGTVFEAEDLQLQERVALKTFHPSVVMDEQAICSSPLSSALARSTLWCLPWPAARCSSWRRPPCSLHGTPQ
jgi:hypothetical protein